MKSKILYIGESKELYRRIHDEHFNKHLKVLMNDRDFGIRTRRIQQMSDKYQYMLYCGAIVDVFYLRLLGGVWIKLFSIFEASKYCYYEKILTRMDSFHGYQTIGSHSYH